MPSPNPKDPTVAPSDPVAPTPVDTNGMRVHAPEHPSRIKRKENRSDLNTVKENAAAANSVPALRDEVARLASVVESLLDRMDGDNR